MLTHAQLSFCLLDSRSPFSLLGSKSYPALFVFWFWATMFYEKCIATGLEARPMLVHGV